MPISADREREVDGFRHSEVSRQQTVQVPEQQWVSERIDSQHCVDIGHCELVELSQRMSQVVPMNTNAYRRRQTSSIHSQ